MKLNTKKTVFLTIVTVFCVQANATTIQCSGTGTINNVGLIEKAELRVKIDFAKKVLSYKGPHASIELPSDREFSLPLTSTVNSTNEKQYYLADASKVGHGTETNLFYLQKKNSDAGPRIDESFVRDFIYQGSYGYRINARLLCTLRRN